MNELEVYDQKQNKVTIDSREIAKMVGIEHADLIKKLEGTSKIIGIIPTLRKGNFTVSEYFIESSYKTEGNNKTYKCYLFTKMGCEFIANKFNGEKGILFTATYVKRFNEMEIVLSNPVQEYLDMDEEDRAIMYFTKLKETKKLESDNKEKDKLLLIAGEKTSFIDDFLKTDALYSIDAVSKILGIKGMGRTNLHKYLRDNEIIMTDTYTDKSGKGKGGINHFKAYAKYTNTFCYFQHRTRDVYVGKDKTIKQQVAMFRPEGITWIYKKLQKDEYVAEKDLETVINELRLEKAV